jgi:hypothetical protein
MQNFFSFLTAFSDNQRSFIPQRGPYLIYQIKGPPLMGGILPWDALRSFHSYSQRTPLPPLLLLECCVDHKARWYKVCLTVVAFGKRLRSYFLEDIFKIF